MADQAAAVAFVAALQPRLVRSLTLHCGDVDVAHELAQETLARVWVHWPRVRRMAAPEAWAFRVALNLASSHFRRAAAERRARDRMRHARPVCLEQDRAEALAVRAAVAALPARQRSALILRYFADLPVADAAAAMGCADGTVKALTAQAIARLRQTAGLLDTVELHDGA